MIWKLIERLEARIDRMSDGAARAVCIGIAVLIALGIGYLLFYANIPM